MIPVLPESFRTIPIAHRALHDAAEGRPENSRAAVRAAVAAGYGIEIDLQLSRDGQAMVFHDYVLDRLTDAAGDVAGRDAADLQQIPLKHDSEGIPTLRDVLEIVAGRVPLLVELKDQDGALGSKVGPLERAVARDLQGYRGDVAVMSFNPHSVAALRGLLPFVPRGLTTEDFTAEPDWPVAEAHRAELSAIPHYDRVGACFVSHHHKQLAMGRVAELKSDGAVILCWTVRSPEEEAAARKVADNVTFEGYLA